MDTANKFVQDRLNKLIAMKRLPGISTAELESIIDNMKFCYALQDKIRKLDTELNELAESCDMLKHLMDRL